MSYTITVEKMTEINEFIHKSVYELYNVGVEKHEMIIQIPENHFKTLLYFIDRSMFLDRPYQINERVHFNGVEVHPIGYESKVVVYYKNVSYKQKELIRIMEI